MNLYNVYYDNKDRVVCVERRQVNGITLVIAGNKPTGDYCRQLVTDTFALSEAIDEALLTQPERLNKAKGARYQRTPELEREIGLDVSYSALNTKYGISKRTYYRLRNELISATSPTHALVQTPLPLPR